MSFTITHRIGSMDTDPSGSWLESLLAELTWMDEEHPDVAVAHESGWSLSAFPSGLVLWQNLDDESLGVRRGRFSPDALHDAFEAVSRGHLDAVEALLDHTSFADAD